MSATEYQETGLTVLPNVIRPLVAMKWRLRAIALAEKVGEPGVIRRDAADGGPGDEGGKYRHVQIDGFATQAHFPALMDWYRDGLPLLVAPVVGPVLLSPWPRSAVNVKVFYGGDEQGCTSTRTV